MAHKLTHCNIEYVRNPDGTPGFNWSFHVGCLHKQQGRCPVENCWAKTVLARQGRDQLKPELIPERLLDPLKRIKPATFAVCFMGDLGGDWVDPKILVDVSDNPLFGTNEKYGKYWELECIVSDVMFASQQHKFLFLTKNPERYKLWGPFPDNAWIGATCWNAESFIDATAELFEVKAKYKWLSIEPLLDSINGGECEGKRLDSLMLSGISWVIIGAEDHPLRLPERSWVDDITKACGEAGIPCWHKNNLKSLMGSDMVQQLPKGVALDH